MRKVVLFIAMSIDGYIADKYGNVDWLNGQDSNEDTIDTYTTFIQDVDTIIMGWNTYYQITTQLSPTEWIYHNLVTYVITHKKQDSTDKIIFTEKNVNDMINALKRKEGKNIWICGGANLVQQLVKANLIDEYYISVIPTILGAGIRLFDTAPKEIKLKLTATQNYNGIVELIYSCR